MKNFLCLAQNVDVMPLLQAVHSSSLWDQHSWRKIFSRSPHSQCSDIWLRFFDTDKLQSEGIVDYAPVNYPGWHELPQVRPIIFDLMRRVEATQLGYVLISRLRPGDRILPHSDEGSDYTKSGSRYHVVLQGLSGSKFIVGDEMVEMRTGSVWWFDHRPIHQVINDSDDDRIHLMIDLSIK